jgi:putative effector of murein hydrolase
VPLLVALLAGSVTAAVSAVLVGKLLGASDATLYSLAPKSVTTPIAMGIAERLGGLPSLTAVLVILTGILGAVGAQGLYALLKCRDPAVQGFAMGVASHGIGTARAFQISEQAGAFSALAMGLNGLLTAVMLPMLLPPIMQWLRQV